MKRLNVLLIIIVFLVTMGGICLAQQVIPWDYADQYYGKNITVEGTIVFTYNTGRACFLSFHPNWKQYFTAVIFRSDFSKFPPKPEEFYKGKKVQISGLVDKYHGRPEIILNDPSQIEILK